MPTVEARARWEGELESWATSIPEVHLYLYLDHRDHMLAKRGEKAVSVYRARIRYKHRILDAGPLGSSLWLELYYLTSRGEWARLDSSREVEYEREYDVTDYFRPGCFGVNVFKVRAPPVLIYGKQRVKLEVYMYVTYGVG